jgi:hypothetical protein
MIETNQSTSVALKSSLTGLPKLQSVVYLLTDIDHTLKFTMVLRGD